MCDRAKMYLGFETIQWCWAHLRRDFVAFSDTDRSINNIGQELVDLTDELFHYWHLFRGGTLTRGGLQVSIADLRVRVEDALDRGARSQHSLIAGRCRNAFEFITDAITKARSHQPLPSLLPAP